MIMATDDRQPKDLSELAREARAQQGMPCPECGYRRHLCYGTIPTGAKIYRYRKCRKCGHKFLSEESPVQQ